MAERRFGKADRFCFEKGQIMFGISADDNRRGTNFARGHDDYPTGVRNDMRIAQEEVFGPVLAVIPFEDEADAVAIGNDVAYGLAAAVWTQNLRRAMAMVEKLQAGTVWVNNYRATSFTSPFGGYKESGIGRESGTETIKEYLNTKCVWISTDLDVPNPFVRR